MDRRRLWFLGLFAPVLTWSWIHPHDRFTWWLESAPIIAGIPVLFALQKNLPCRHCCSALVGALVAVLGFSRLHDRSLAKSLARR